MIRPRLLALLGAGVLLTAVALRKPSAPAVASAPSASVPAPVPAAPGASVPLPQEEIFRRAFWRQPTAEDHLLHAERREWSAGHGTAAPALQRWQWFLAVHPSPGLLRTLRDPETFGLQPVTATPRPWSEPAPAWFPAAVRPAEFEVLQTSASRLTLLYRSSDNTLFATDTGQGFTAPVRPVSP